MTFDYPRGVRKPKRAKVPASDADDALADARKRLSEAVDGVRVARERAALLDEASGGARRDSDARRAASLGNR